MKRVLIVYDVTGWAWHHMAKGIQKYAPREYDVTVVDTRDYGWIGVNAQDKLASFDAIFAMSWVEMGFPDRAKRRVSLLASHGAEYPWPHDDKSYSARIATRLRNTKHAEETLPGLDSIICVSRNLCDVGLQFNKNSHYCHPGVDHDVFRPGDQRVPDRLRIGWCGQRLGTTKGLNEVFQPLVALLHNRFEWIINDRDSTSPLSQVEMVKWHQHNDIFLSTSSSEGCQMPIMEAAACGKPVIATNVGTAIEVINDMDTGYVVNSYDNTTEAKHVVDQIANSLVYLDENRNKLVSMGFAARQRIENLFTWERQAPVWLKAIAG